MGLTVVEPTRVLVENDPGVMAIDDAFATFHESTVEEPAAISEGDALKDEMVGAPGAATIGRVQLVGAALSAG